jgi:hypothetical protein
VFLHRGAGCKGQTLSMGTTQREKRECPAVSEPASVAAPCVRSEKNAIDSKTEVLFSILDSKKFSFPSIYQKYSCLIPTWLRGTRCMQGVSAIISPKGILSRPRFRQPFSSWSLSKIQEPFTPSLGQVILSL